MGDSYGAVKVAAVQAASVFLDREGSTGKACRLIREAGKNGARVIGFPEGFIPAHPVWYHHHAATGAVANRLAVELFKNSVEVPGPETEALCDAARDVNAYVVVGVCEKLPDTTGTAYSLISCEVRPLPGKFASVGPAKKASFWNQAASDRSTERNDGKAVVIDAPFTHTSGA